MRTDSTLCVCIAAALLLSWVLSHAVSPSPLRHELVFIDAGVEGHDQLLAELRHQREGNRHLQVHVLDAQRDGIEQISEVLAGYRKLDAVHLVAHGTAGVTQLGNTMLRLDTLSRYTYALARWQDALGRNADLLFYSCQLAESETGQRLLHAIRAITGADVAASINATGHADLDGDWHLEFASGRIETAGVFSPQAQQTWVGRLAVFNVTHTADSGPGSLRQAILNANASGGFNTIAFSIPLTDPNHYYYQDDGIVGSLSLIVVTPLDDASISDFDPDYPGLPRSWYTIVPSSPLPDLDDDVAIDGTTQLGYTDAPIIELDGSAMLSPNVNGLRLSGNNIWVQGLVINRFTGHGLALLGNTSIIETNYVGLDVSGTMGLGNGKQGIQIDNSNTHTIGGTTPGAGNVISGNAWSGVSIQLGGSSDNVIQGNLIGTDATGTLAIGNGNYGVDIFNGGPSGNLIGGSIPGAGNVISGNTWEGVQIKGAGTTNNTVLGNAIGSDSSGTIPIPNGLGGIVIEQGATTNAIGGMVVGAGNVIAFNNGDGIKLEDASTDFNVIQGNLLYANLGLGIDLNDDGVSPNDLGDSDGGANSRQNFPVLTSANTDGGGTLYVGGVINSTAGRTFRVELFTNTATDPSGHGEGEKYLGFTTVTTGAAGNGAFSAVLSTSVPVGSFITATATDLTTNETSEFSISVTALAMHQLVVDTTSDDADAPDTTSITALLSDRGPDDLISLREAILATNGTPNGAMPDEIHFHIPDIDPNHFYYQDDTTPGSLSPPVPTLLDDASISDFDPDYPGTPHSWFTIAPTALLPSIMEAVRIDGYTQPGAATNTLPAGTDAILRIELDGSSAGGGADGLRILGGTNSTLRGLVVNRFDDAGIFVRDVDAQTLEGNYIGTDITGTLDRGNGDDGISIENSDGNTIGGSTPASRNVVAGNDKNGIVIFNGSTGNVVAGNFIGVDATGTVDRGNSESGIQIYTNGNLIGGAAPGTGNVISGNGNDGINIDGSSATGNIVQGNVIGSDLSGVMATLGNTANGITIQSSASTNTIGGTATGEGNLIAFNTVGVAITQNGSDFNSIRGNSIYANADLGIDLNNDGPTPNDLDDSDGNENDLVNYPVITSAVTNEVDTITISGTLNSLVTTTFDLDFFYTDTEGGEGQVYLGSIPVSTNGSGTATFTNIPFAPFAVPASAYITATATVTTGPETGNTSEFSADFQATVANQPPTASIPASSYPVLEHTPLDLHLIGMAVSDPDAGTNDVQATLSVGEGVLTVSAGSTGVIVAGSGGSTVTLDGRLTEINDALSGNLGATLVYTALADPSSSTPLTLTLNDLGHSGSGGPMSDNDIATLDITAENDDPSNTGSLPTDVGVIEDVATQVDLSAMNVSDVDAGAMTLTLILSTSTGGTLSASDSGGVTVGGSGTGTLTLDGTVVALNAFLDNPTHIQYVSAPNASGDNADSLTLDVTDNGHTGAGGGGLIALGSVNVDIAPVGDTPQVASLITLEDTQSSAILVDRHANDGGEVTHFRISNILNGTLYQNDGLTVINSGDFILVADGQAGLTFTPSLNSTAPGRFDVQASEDGSTVAAQSGTASSIITVTPVGDTPQAASLVTLEDTQSGAIILNRHAHDGGEVTHFRISNIVGGTLYENDGATLISNGDFITVLQGNMGLKFTPSLHSTSAGSFGVESSEDGSTVAAQSGVATSTITVTPVGDTPQAASVLTTEDTQSGPILLDRNANDGGEVTHFRISNIIGGTLYQNDGVTVINTGDFILVTDGQAGLRFTPAFNSTAPGSFHVESSEDGLTVAAQSGIATSMITVTPVGDTPSVTSASTFEDTQTTSGLVITPHASDGAEVTHFNITTITGGTLFHTDGVTPISNGDFITVAEGSTGLTFTPALHSTVPGRFDVASSEDGLTVAAQSGVATATISITPVGDTPQAASMITVEDTQSGAIVLDRHVNDGSEVTHFRISNIVGGTLYHSDGLTVINAGVYITVGDGNAGLRFTPAPDSTLPGSFEVESSEDGFTVAAQSGVATSTITVTPVGDTPQAESIVTFEETQSGPIGLNRNPNDGLEVTHFRISTIVGGTLYQNDGVTAINDGDFITVAEGQAGLRFTPAVGSTTPGRFEVESSEDGATVAAQSGVATATITLITASGLWLSTEDDVPSPSQAPGLDSWGQDEVLAFDEPNFNLEPGMTDGTLYPVLNLDAFAQDGDADVKGMHYVSQDLSIGGTFFPAIDLFTGDLLLIVDADETLDGTGANLLSVTPHDVVVFRPDVAGDYSAGTFWLLLQDPSGDPLRSLSLIENLTLVGDVTLAKGTFIFSQMNHDDDAIYHFATDDVGVNTSGAVSVLLDGSNFGLDQPVAGLDLIEQSLTAGGTALQAGTLLVTLASDDDVIGTVNPIDTNQQDLFVLDVSTTSMGSGTSAANATLLLEGSDTGLNTDAEDLDAVTLLATVVNNAPTASNSTVSAMEDTAYPFTISDFNFADLDGGSLALIRIKTVETAGDLELSGVDVTASQVILATDISAGNLTFTADPDANDSNYATFEFYVHDGIEYSDNSYTLTLDVAEQADTPSVTSTTTDEDTQSSTGLVLALNAVDGEGVTHFKITAINGGILYQNDGVTAINSGDFITFAQGDAGLKFTPPANSTANGSFDVQASTANHDAGLGGNSVSATITVTPVGDTPQAASIVTLEDTPSGPIVLDRNLLDGPEVTHFRITNITGGVLVLSDGVTIVNPGDFITVSQGHAGLRFTPALDSHAGGHFEVEASEDGLTVAAQSGIATATISVTPVADIPSVTPAATLEDTQTASGLVLSRHVADGPEVTHFNITNIAGGTLYQNDGTTVIHASDFITFAQGTAGLKFTPSLNSTTNGSFDVQASTAGMDSGLGGGIAAATIRVSPVNDSPSAIIALANYAASEGTPLTLHGTGLSVDDPDAGANPVRVTLSVGEGSVTATAGSTGVTVSSSDSTSVILDGTLSQINDVLAGHLGATLIYDAAATTDTVLTLHIDDRGASGAGGSLTATDTATLSIPAAAVNHSPTAIQVSPNAVDETTDTRSGYRIGTLTTTDPDSADTFTYMIVGGADAVRFSIGGIAANELILTDGILDHETTSSYDVTVRVTDSGGLSHDATLAIHVTDLVPVITAGQSFRITETDATGALVGTVGTTGDTATIFAITSGNVNNAFAIDAGGTITVADSSVLDVETTSSYTLTIEVSDGAHSVSETVTITVTDVTEPSSSGGSGQNSGGSGAVSTPASAGGVTLVPDPTPAPEGETPEPVRADSSPSAPTPAEDESPEPQTPAPQVANPLTPRPQTPRPQTPAPQPTRLGTGNTGFRPNPIRVPSQPREPVNPPAPTSPTPTRQADEGIIPEVPPVSDEPPPLQHAAGLLQAFDEMREEMRDDFVFNQVAIGSTVALATGFSIGYVLWLIRGGLLLSSLLSSLPAWRFVDPLPVLKHLGAHGEADDTDDESLEAILQQDVDMAPTDRESTTHLQVERDGAQPGA